MKTADTVTGARSTTTIVPPLDPARTTREAVNELEERNAELHAELHAINESLRTELAVVEQRNQQLMSDRGTLREREISYVYEMDRIAERRERAEVRAEDVEERIRVMRRVFTGSERMLRQRLEERVERLEE